MLDLLLQFFSGVSAAESRIVLEPLLIFVLGMAIYSIFIYKLYKFVSRRRIFTLVRGDSLAWKAMYFLEYLFLFPVIAFCWFLVMSILLTILSQVVAINNIFMVSMATIATIRITAYYDELLSQEIAKLIPLALLAVFLLDISAISAEEPLQVIMNIPNHAETLFYYFVFIVSIEFFLKILNHIWEPYRKRK